MGHSLSPPMHEAAHDDLGLEARYVTLDPGPTLSSWERRYTGKVVEDRDRNR